ncbi:PepSY domain-containing protein [Burkholderiaceae bacterium DAT-1]|nr:PepSY domain-containing protein [Burkholderiaceae bacterium DAT-1]
MRWSPFLFKWHRRLGYIVAIQVFLWLLGGTLFALMPFADWVKAEASVRKPVLHVTAPPAALPALPDGMQQIQAVQTATGAAWKVKAPHSVQMLDWHTGQPLPAAPDESAIRRFAQSLYLGSSAIEQSTRLDTLPVRLGMVQEIRAKPPVWQVRFDDALKTRMYFDARTGEFIGARNNAWVLYDFFWRLHVMDYSEGEDFNNPLLRVASVLGLLLCISGMGMLGLSMARMWRRKHH